LWEHKSDKKKPDGPVGGGGVVSRKAWLGGVKEKTGGRTDQTQRQKQGVTKKRLRGVQADEWDTQQNTLNETTCTGEKKVIAGRRRF